MTKRQSIYIILFFVLIGLAFAYYFFEPTGQQVTTTPVTGGKVEISPNPDNTPEAKNQAGEEMPDRAETNGDPLAELSPAEATQGEGIYVYRQSFRDPFAADQPAPVNGPASEPADQKLSEKELLALVPFQIRGIIGNEQQRLAIVSSHNQSRILRPDDVISGFKVLAIKEDAIVLSYQGIVVNLELGSDSVDR